MKIREATLSDLERIAELYLKNHTETYRGLLSDDYFERLTPDYAKEKWGRFLYSEGKKIWVAYDKDDFLGFTAGTKDTSLAGTWYLDSLHVTERARGKGIGTAFIEIMMQYAAENGYSGMSVCIVKGNDHAGNLYKKHGAKHLLDFEDDFCGTVSRSEKLLWENLRENC
jgi:ribosomal protein S18 acetylase RimI-like enzyme